MSDAHRLTYQIAFSSFRSLHPALAATIIGRAGSEENFFRLPESQLSAMMGFRNKLFSVSVRNEALRQAELETRFVEANGISCIYYTDPGYPQRLLQCDDAPLMIYGLGQCDLDNSRIISIVGTRHATAYGNDFVSHFVGDLTSILPEKPVIVSGLAYGIDIAAHRAAIAAGAPTVAVLAHGLNTIYPAAHRPIAAEIATGSGMLMTDYPSSAAIHKGNFLARNRIIAGLCDALIVVESASAGGALVTARLASGYNRDVFALPGRTSDKYSSGCNSLIASQIAGLVTSAADFAKQMGWTTVGTADNAPQLFADITPEEQQIIDLMTDRGEMTLQELSCHIDMPTPRLMSTLIDMEFRSLLLQIPGGRYRLR